MAYRHEIRSIHVLQTTKEGGVDQGRRIKRGSEEWNRIVSSLDVKSIPVAETATSGPDFTPLTVEYECGYCKNPFSKLQFYGENRPNIKYCDDYCKKAAHRVKKGKCPTCNENVDKVVPTKKFCNKECRVTWHSQRRQRTPKRKSCEQCGQFFQPKNVNSRYRFCKQECRVEYHSGLLKQQTVERAANRICVIEGCGKAFDYRIVGHRKYCSDECLLKARAQQMRDKRSTTPKSERPPLICGLCNQEYVPTHNYSRSKYCSRPKCVNKKKMLYRKAYRKRKRTRKK